MRKGRFQLARRGVVVRWMCTASGHTLAASSDDGHSAGAILFDDKSMRRSERGRLLASAAHALLSKRSSVESSRRRQSRSRGVSAPAAAGCAPDEKLREANGLVVLPSHLGIVQPVTVRNVSRKVVAYNRDNTARSACSRVLSYCLAPTISKCAAAVAPAAQLAAQLTLANQSVPTRERVQLRCGQPSEVEKELRVLCEPSQDAFRPRPSESVALAPAGEGGRQAVTQRVAIGIRRELKDGRRPGRAACQCHSSPLDREPHDVAQFAVRLIWMHVK